MERAPRRPAASSGDQIRHRLSRAGNRQINRALPVLAVVQLCHRESEGRAEGVFRRREDAIRYARLEGGRQNAVLLMAGSGEPALEAA